MRARFGVEHPDTALPAQGRRVLVADSDDSSDNPVAALLKVLTSIAPACTAPWSPEPGVACGGGAEERCH